ncbi:hypothetical protein VTK73DRAFT_5920 [Phialemonium thermophilum]|uniref:Uncharacterized protein n=1 Tax=Phialemonium thermophilum TaxID=223376 RepID=A0ABR3V0A6_9PEZI
MGSTSMQNIAIRSSIWANPCAIRVLYRFAKPGTSPAWTTQPCRETLDSWTAVVEVSLRLFASPPDPNQPEAADPNQPEAADPNQLLSVPLPPSGCGCPLRTRHDPYEPIRRNLPPGWIHGPTACLLSAAREILANDRLELLEREHYEEHDDPSCVGLGVNSHERHIHVLLRSSRVSSAWGHLLQITSRGLCRKRTARPSPSPLAIHRSYCYLPSPLETRSCRTTWSQRPSGVLQVSISPDRLRASSYLS